MNDSMVKVEQQGSRYGCIFSNKSAYVMPSRSRRKLFRKKASKKRPHYSNSRFYRTVV